jgi:cytochrome c551/c552
MPRILGFHALFAALLLACRAHEPERNASAASGGDPARGFERVRALGCTGCHASAEVVPEPAPRLEAVGARLAPEALLERLAGGARMPDCLAPLAPPQRDAAREALTHFLAARGGPLAPEPLRVDAASVERGRQLYHAVGCVACHEPFEAAATLTRALWDFEESFETRAKDAAPGRQGPRDPASLRGLARGTTLAALAELLVDPLAVHPSGRMPALGLDAREARDVAAYLLYEDLVDLGRACLVPAPGLALELFEGSFPGESVDFEALAPVRTETATSFFEGLELPEDDFALRFRGFLTVAAGGSHAFHLRSDDGSVLRIDGRVVVDNDGQHGMEERSGALVLDKGLHAFELTYFEHLGDAGLEVAWTPPGGARGPLGFEHLSHLVVDARADAPFEELVPTPRLAERGRALYAELGCASCHEAAAPRARPFGELDPRRGCLAPEPAGLAPRYHLAPDERADLVAAVRARTPPALDAEARLSAELARLACGACHERGDLTGPSDARRAYFRVRGGLDLGDQGRFPPSLERAGAKSKPSWLAHVLATGEGARPYLEVRMPRFGAANVAALPELFAAADAALRDEREPEFSPEAVAAGRELAGTRGLGCIQCHEFAGHPSLGIPAVDLAAVHARLYPGWFRELLMDPVALGMNTRMPAFWVDGKSPVHDVLGGDPARQVDALWTYLSLGSSMPLPQGLVPREGEYEVEVIDAPVCVGVFMKGVGPRTLAVGLPERVHYAFDVEHSRLALAWRGRFLDARGTWHGRAGELERPAGEDVLEFAPGCALMMLDARDDPWPSELGRVAGIRARGRHQDDAGRPVFAYTVCGVAVEESVRPVLRPGGGALVRRFQVSPPARELYLRIARGAAIERIDDEAWRIRGDRELRVRAPAGAFVVNAADGVELRASSAALLEVEYSW